MLRRPVRPVLAIPLALAAAAVACSNFNRIEGTVATADGAANVHCMVSNRPAAFENARWDACGPADVPPVDFASGTQVAVGERFTCSVGANVDRVYAVQVECPGYQARVLEVFVPNCASLFGGCDIADAGTIVVQR